ncbi:MAG: YciI family protein [Pseudomonadota bacterium]
MKFAIIFEDDPNADPAIRARHMADHLSFLEANADKITAAGPLSGPDGAAAGGLWILDASDSADVERLVHQDPFWPTGLRKGYRVLNWTQVFADGRRVIPDA